MAKHWRKDEMAWRRILRLAVRLTRRAWCGNGLHSYMDAKNLFRGTAVALVVGLSVWQAQVSRRLKAERDALSARAAALDELRDENLRLKQTQIEPDELNRLRKNEAELLRLRGETAQLRQQLKTLRESKPPAPAKESVPAVPTVEMSDGPVQTFTSTVHASLVPGQSLVAGGWRLPGGKRGVVLVEPSYVNAAGNLLDTPVSGGQVVIQARFVELSDEVMAKAGLDSLKADTKETSGHGVLDAQQAKDMIALLETSQSVNVLSAPRVLTLEGRQAQINLIQSKTINDQSYEVGPSLDVVPRVSADGRTTDLSIVARIRLEGSPAK